MNYCSVENCPKKIKAVHLCTAHLQKYYKYGSPVSGKQGNVRLPKYKKGELNSVEYRTLNGMKNRCYNSKTQSYKYYGGRGVTICDKWLGQDGYKNFLADMGRKPSPKHSIDRIDNNGNYEPGNCRWATIHEQSINKRPIVKGHYLLGVSYHKKTNRWVAHMRFNKQLVLMKYFRYEDLDEAIAARKAAEIKYLGATIKPT